MQRLFDELVELPEEQQDSAIASMEVNAEVKAWLYQLLAGDRYVGGVIDESIESVANALLKIKLTLQKILAKVQGNLGNHVQAQVIYEDLLSGLESNSAPMVELSQVHTDIAAQLKYQGELDTALEQVEKAIDLAPLRSGEQAVIALREKASILSELRRNDEAVVVLETGLVMRDQILELSNGEQLLGHLLADLSGEQGALGEPEKASATLDEAMSLYDRVYTSVHPELTAAHSRRAAIERGAGQFENAVKASFIAAIQSNEMFGIEHSQTLRSYAALAVDLAYLTCYPEAIDLYEEIVDRHRTIYGKNNILTGSVLLNLAAMRRKVYDYEAALVDINETLAIFSEQSEPITDKQSFALATKAQVLFALKRDGEAEAVHLEAASNVNAESSPNVAWNLSKTGSTYSTAVAYRCV